jgi:hypothetical protein
VRPQLRHEALRRSTAGCRAARSAEIGGGVSFFEGDIVPVRNDERDRSKVVPLAPRPIGTRERYLLLEQLLPAQPIALTSPNQGILARGCGGAP